MPGFAGDITRVANTRIFARASDNATQFLVIQLEYDADRDAAMILPLPTPAASADNAVRFLDLAAYPEFFQDLANGFPIARSAPPVGDALTVASSPAGQGSGATAMFIPSRAGLKKIESNLQIDDEIWDRLPEYHDYGFAVFTLSASEHSVPPLAFEFPVRNPHLLYFPTVHILHGEVQENVYFDHDLFCQAHAGWMRSYDIAFSFMDIELAQGIVTPHQRVERLTVLGIHPNSDIVLNLEQ